MTVQGGGDKADRMDIRAGADMLMALTLPFANYWDKGTLHDLSCRVYVK